MSEGTGSLKYEIHQTKPFHSIRHEAVLGLLKTSDLVRRVISNVVEPAGITMQQYNVLRILRGAGAEALPTLEIRARMIEQTPGITRLLDKLERRGWVTRNRHSGDRRQVLCLITPQGKQLIDSLDDSVDAIYGQLLGAVSDTDVQVLVRAMDAVRASQSAKSA
ncbi:MAG: MarR family transcriptional regulator [Acidobacteria bacterium]|nr:MarR family transcriptional regulator [Acidobacteriota bacterium]MDA1236427.1 MarR family transcriptional regulator [Acidobacteriota bacterium]